LYSAAHVDKQWISRDGESTQNAEMGRQKRKKKKGDGDGDGKRGGECGEQSRRTDGDEMTR